MEFSHVALLWLYQVTIALSTSTSLTPFQPYLSSRDTFIILDNVKSILDPQGADA